MGQTQFFGIRHHGPGSAKSLLKGLEKFSPDCLLIEIPQDCENLIHHTDFAELHTPVAILLYDKKNPKRAAYLPFALFSPEWQALNYAQENQCAIQCIDLPYQIQFSFDQQSHRDQLKLWESDNQSDEESLQAEIRRDPLAYLSKLASYSDSERWWEQHIEISDNPEQVFDLVSELMKDLRTQTSLFSSTQEEMREEYMSKKIAKAEREGYQRIAVVCGAWHVSALKDPALRKKKNQHKAGKRINTDAQWIPWSYQRLSMKSGYRAGIKSPTYYEYLYVYGEKLIQSWLISAADLLRKNGFSASSAEVIDAGNMAARLADIRQHPIPFLEDLEDAVYATMCAGSEKRFQLIRHQLVIGHKIGKVSKNQQMLPIRKDFEQKVKSARLSRFLESDEVFERKLDLRKASNQHASVLLHRLQLLGIYWGTKKEPDIQAYGSFHEWWELQWFEEFEIELIEAGFWGTSIEEAVVNKISQTLFNSPTLSEISILIENLIAANLPQVLTSVFKRISELLHSEEDLHMILEVMVSLLHSNRYGGITELDRQSVHSIIDRILVSLHSELSQACSFIELELASAYSMQIKQCDVLINHSNQEQWVGIWREILLNLGSRESVHPLIRGVCTAINVDRELLSDTDVEKILSHVCSPAYDEMHTALWLEGHFTNRGMILLHKTQLMRLVDHWIQSLSKERFTELMPILRRSFAHFDKHEKEAIYKAVEDGIPDDDLSNQSQVEEQTRQIPAILDTLFG